MRLLLPILLTACLATPALARDRSQPLPDPATRRVKVPPIRIDTRSVFRDDTNPGFLFETGVQARRWEKAAVELNVAGIAGHSLGFVGPFRTMSSVESTVDAVRDLGPWVTTGPSLGLSYRMFRQQWTPIDQAWIPLAGWRLSTSVLRTRRWSLAIHVKAMVDLNPTRLVLETAEIRRLPPFEGQLGLRWNFGHGRPR